MSSLSGEFLVVIVIFAIIGLILYLAISLVLMPVSILLKFYVGNNIIPIKLTKLRMFLVIILLIIANKTWKYTTQPFVFENFGTTQEAQKYFDEHYLVETKISKLIEDIENSGGKCVLNATKHKEDFNYFMWYGCSYENDFFSFHPFGRFSITIYADKSNKLISGFYILHHDKFLI